MTAMWFQRPDAQAPLLRLYIPLEDSPLLTSELYGDCLHMVECLTDATRYGQLS